jgi:hypothetical protein
MKPSDGDSTVDTSRRVPFQLRGWKLAALWCLTPLVGLFLLALAAIGFWLTMVLNVLRSVA